MNGIDLLTYSQMKQHQARLLCEAAGLHLARAAAKARRRAGEEAPATQAAHVATYLEPGSRPAAGSRTRRGLSEAPTALGVGLPVRPGGRRMGRLAARLGNSLVAVGRRLERLDRG